MNKKPSNLSERLAYVRTLHGKTMRGLSTEAGLAAGHVHRIENGQMDIIALKTVSKLLKIMPGVPFDWLVFGRGTTPTKRSMKI